MKAVFLVKNGSADVAFEIRETTKPDFTSNQVLIKVEAFGLNFADVMARKGLYRETPPLPTILGYDVVGEILEQGKDVPENLLGKRVVAMTRFGGYAEYVATDYRACVEIPNTMDCAKALALATQYTTAWYSIQKAQIEKGDNVLVHSCMGGVGVALTQLCKLKEAKVFGTTSSKEKQAQAKQMGIDEVADYDNYFNIFSDKLKQQRFQASFNAVGGKTLKQDLKLIGSGGSLICFGASTRTNKKGGFFSNLNLLFSSGFVHPLFLMMRSKSVVGVNMLKLGDYRPQLVQTALNKAGELAKDNKINPLSGGVFSITDLNKAHNMLEHRKSIGKIAIKW